MGKNTRLKKLARLLLAATCLTAGAAILANAQIVTEGTSPAPLDFGNTFGAAYLLPDGTTQVNGSVDFGGDPADFFTFADLAEGTGFSFTATSTLNRTIDLDLFDGCGSPSCQIGSTDVFDATESTSGSGLVPADGTLTFELSPSGAGEGIRPYQITLTTGTPEPGTLGVMGLGLAAGAALAHRRRTKI